MEVPEGAAGVAGLCLEAKAVGVARALNKLTIEDIESDFFRIRYFKVLACINHEPHDPESCPFRHPNEKASRRDPQKYSYGPLACPHFRKGQCPNGDQCPCAHGVFEKWLHEKSYRTQFCNRDRLPGKDVCDRKICFFAHNESELRVVSPKSLSGLAAASSEDSQQSSPGGAQKLLTNCSEGKTGFHLYLENPYPATHETSMDFSTTTNSLVMPVARASSLGTSPAFQRGGATLQSSLKPLSGNFRGQGRQFLGTPPFYAQGAGIHATSSLPLVLNRNYLPTYQGGFLHDSLAAQQHGSNTLGSGVNRQKFPNTAAGLSVSDATCLAAGQLVEQLGQPHMARLTWGLSPDQLKSQLLETAMRLFPQLNLAALVAHINRISVSDVARAIQLQQGACAIQQRQELLSRQQQVVQNMAAAQQQLQNALNGGSMALQHAVSTAAASTSPFWPPASQCVPSGASSEAEVLLQRALSSVMTPELGAVGTNQDYTNGYPVLDGGLPNPSQGTDSMMGHRAPYYRVPSAGMHPG